MTNTVNYEPGVLRVEAIDLMRHKEKSGQGRYSVHDGYHIGNEYNQSANVDKALNTSVPS